MCNQSPTTSSLIPFSLISRFSTHTHTHHTHLLATITHIHIYITPTLIHIYLFSFSTILLIDNNNVLHYLKTLSSNYLFVPPSPMTSGHILLEKTAALYLFVSSSHTKLPIVVMLRCMHSLIEFTKVLFIKAILVYWVYISTKPMMIVPTCNDGTKMFLFNFQSKQQQQHR